MDWSKKKAVEGFTYPGYSVTLLNETGPRGQADLFSINTLIGPPWDTGQILLFQSCIHLFGASPDCARRFCWKVSGPSNCIERHSSSINSSTKLLIIQLSYHCLVRHFVYGQTNLPGRHYWVINVGSSLHSNTISLMCVTGLADLQSDDRQWVILTQKTVLTSTSTSK